MDHCPRQKRRPNPIETANIFSLLSFAYIGKLLKNAFNRDLSEDDLYEVIRSCGSEKCGNKIEKVWASEKEKNEKQGKPVSLTKILLRRWGRKYLIYGLVDFCWSTVTRVPGRHTRTHNCSRWKQIEQITAPLPLRTDWLCFTTNTFLNVIFSTYLFVVIMRPYALSNFIAYFTPGSNISRNEAYFFASLVVLLNVAQPIYMHNYIIWGQIFGTEVKTAFSTMLYSKSLKLTLAALSELSVGNIITLVTKDVQMLRVSLWVINDVWIGMTQVLVICTLLYLKLGPISLIGIGVLIICLVLEVYIGKWVMNLRLQTNSKTDERLKLTQEVLSTIKIIKIYTWEKFFADRINQARRKEIIKFVLVFYLKTTMNVIGVLMSKIGFYVLITACIWFNITTDTAVILYVLTNFKSLRVYMGWVLPSSIGQFGELISSFQRIMKVLNAEEFTPDHQDQPTEKALIELNNVTMHIKDTKILKNISFTITSGLTLITGQVGSGKSSVFKAILQNYPIREGSLRTQGRISYASQDPWLFPSSIKQNILFGEKYDEKRYQEVVRVCALLFDFNLLDKGDETILTDRGLNLSRGQQARINLARAVYRDSEIYLLDDCLTALDGVVQDYIFSECIQKFLKEKICILITQNNSHLKDADTVIVMDNGKITNIGSPDEKAILDYKQVIVEDNYRAEVTKSQKEEVDEYTTLLETEQYTTKKRVYYETQKQGAINFETYKKYFIYGGGILAVLLNFFGGGLAQFAISYSEKLLAQWVDKKQIVQDLEANLTAYATQNVSFNFSSLENAMTEENKTFKFYTIVVLASTALELLKTHFMVDFCRRSAINVHKDMIKKIINAVMSFFDTHLIGNILNRFSQDLLSIDEQLPIVLNECYSVFFSVGGGLLLIISVNLQFSVYILIMLILLIILRHFYLPAGRSLKRLEALTRSPMIGHLNATLEGLTTIRVCKVENILIQEYNKHQDVYTSAYFMYMSAIRGIGLYMHSVATMMVIVVVVKFMFFNSDATAGDVALALTQVVVVCQDIQWGVREWAELETYMSSVERLLEYTEIETEQKGGRMVENWPSRGSITYENVSLSYNKSNELVLIDLNFDIKPGEKIGIVGRTGAGKSSIISTIFRLYDVQGNILIDGIDIKTLSLDFLRKNIAIIPQEPIIFSGSIRSNLDALNEFTDVDLWSALDKVGMRKYFTSLYQIVDSASFSSGQKQLISLARAILHKNKIVVMDEATANMDEETDAALHKIIKENFSSSTVLTIAHRLQSVLDCDKVMVLDRGKIVEFNDLRTLLSNKESLFYKMVIQAGLQSYTIN